MDILPCHVIQASVFLGLLSIPEQIREKSLQAIGMLNHCSGPLPQS
ncbi:hypothetical protein FOMG_17979 [Fusarium oxysporum f. sp. melonis 26406]|uniref:Uncharacterized protein n=1 Tax=Fusarium oxysporum f. sp. melonis 26406 TaxID=1089452 RepID=W9Z9R2_FUSOX|nr:hypothetical protein FOMG_17979 [Fusarium oxysporum f. sp. melonis 26406]